MEVKLLDNNLRKAFDPQVQKNKEMLDEQKNQQNKIVNILKNALTSAKLKEDEINRLKDELDRREEESQERQRILLVKDQEVSQLIREQRDEISELKRQTEELKDRVQDSEALAKAAIKQAQKADEQLDQVKRNLNRQTLPTASFQSPNPFKPLPPLNRQQAHTPLAQRLN